MTSAAPPIKMRLGGGHVCIEVDDGALINGQSTSSTQEACASCGVSAARKLWCWGKNDQRQSVSNETERLTSVGGNSRCGVEVMTEPMPIDVSNTDANVTGGACPLQVPYSIDELALGRSHACTRIKHPQYPINPDQALACWGEQSLIKRDKIQHCRPQPTQLFIPVVVKYRFLCPICRQQSTCWAAVPRVTIPA